MAKAHKDRILRASRFSDVLCSAVSWGSNCFSWYKMSAGPLGWYLITEYLIRKSTTLVGLAGSGGNVRYITVGCMSWSLPPYT